MESILSFEEEERRCEEVLRMPLREVQCTPLWIAAEHMMPAEHMMQEVRRPFGQKKLEDGRLFRKPHLSESLSINAGSKRGRNGFLSEQDRGREIKSDFFKIFSTHHKDTPHKALNIASQDGPNIVIVLSGNISKSALEYQTARLDIHIGDQNLLNEKFRQAHGIQDIIAIKNTLLPYNIKNIAELDVEVRMRPFGEGKESWEHCKTQDGDTALPEMQTLYLTPILQKRSSFPASATWFLETPEKCDPSSVLEGLVELQIVPSGGTAETSSTEDVGDSGNPVIRLSFQVQDTDCENKGGQLEEKFQTESMEK